ncbi:hypothetical protein [Terrabacter carboxydivorans]|uniref:hypothetical protein n=1 Tax=Terrabacter carboxydivorans TaxID=619730 RepID=UPI0031DE126A
MPPAPRYQREAVPPDQVEVRLVLYPYGKEEPAVRWWRELPQNLSRAAAVGPQAGVTVQGPFVESEQLTLYVRGPSDATVLEFARSQVLRPSPGRVYAFVSAPGQLAPQTGRAVLLDATTRPTPARTR